MMARMNEYPTSFSQQAHAAYEHLRTHPRRVRLTPSQRDRIVREVRAERAQRGAPPRARRWLARSA